MNSNIYFYYSKAKYATIEIPTMLKILTIASFILPALIAVIAVLLGYVKFWYDPARDLLTAWDNIFKPTLIGPTSGVPGIFYGPYWIWLLSLGERVSKDPTIVALLTATIPYFVIFPFVWFKFSKFFGQQVVIIGWLLFILSTGFTYGTQLWNPYPAPLLTLVVIYLLIRYNFLSFSLPGVLVSFFVGFLLGLVINFHISFGIGFTFGVFIFLLWECIKPLFDKKKKNAKLIFIKISFLFITGLGIFVAFLPTLLFEIRHGFNQIQTLLHAFSQYGNVVTTKGLSKYFIFTNFIDAFGQLLHLPTILAGVVLVTLIGFFIWLIANKKIQLNQSDIRVTHILLATLFGIGFIYFTAKNPVWAYHFIGVDIIFLITLTFLLSKLPLFKHAFILLLIYIIGISVYGLVHELSTRGISVLDKQKEVVQTISKDAGTSPYTVFAYSPSIYSYEYAYLFRWIANKNVPFDPGQNPTGSSTVYLIIPVKTNSEIQDFTNFRTPQKEYLTAKNWTLYNDVTIVKKIKK
jgi:hypothetical protein